MPVDMPPVCSRKFTLLAWCSPLTPLGLQRPTQRHLRAFTRAGYDVSMTNFPSPATRVAQPRWSPIARWASACVCLLGLWAAPVAQARDTHGMPQLGLPRTTLQAGMFRIDTQVASTPEQRAVGLMWRRGMPQHEGMLFVFEEPAVQCFWMKNTPSALTAAFVADDGTVVNLADMRPLSEDSHCSTKPVRFVLEMNQGWFDTRAIKPGFRLVGAPFVK